MGASTVTELVGTLATAVPVTNESPPATELPFATNVCAVTVPVAAVIFPLVVRLPRALIVPVVFVAGVLVAPFPVNPISTRLVPQGTLPIIPTLVGEPPVGTPVRYTSQLLAPVTAMVVIVLNTLALRVFPPSAVVPLPLPWVVPVASRATVA